VQNAVLIARRQDHAVEQTFRDGREAQSGGSEPKPEAKVAQPGKTAKPANPKPPCSMLRRWGLANDAVKTSWK
jgi:hypothetical protein